MSRLLRSSFSILVSNVTLSLRHGITWIATLPVSHRGSVAPERCGQAGVAIAVGTGASSSDPGRHMLLDQSVPGNTFPFKWTLPESG